jgi:hypothetical protein
VSAGLFDSPDDIYWLEQAEAELDADRVDRGKDFSNLTTTILQRQAARRAAKKATPPVSLPQRSFLGKGKRKAGGSEDQAGQTWKGAASSPGKVTARACILDGPGDFGRMKTGDVLVPLLPPRPGRPFLRRRQPSSPMWAGPSVMARSWLGSMANQRYWARALPPSVSKAGRL